MSDQRHTILLVEDSPIAREMLRLELEACGYQVEEACDGHEARQLMEQLTEIDAVLLDWHLPGANGIDLLRDWMGHAQHRWIPVVMITADDDPDKIHEALRAGAVDFMHKPPDAIEMHARLSSALRIKGLYDELRSLAMHDPLTGLLNRRALDIRLEDEVSRALRYDRELSCAMVDIDHFKQVNDVHGHRAGDLALQHVATMLSRGVRRADTVARWGGEEFVVLLPETSLEAGVLAMNRQREALARQPCELRDSQLHVCWSAGVASLRSLAEPAPGALIAAADQALYRAKAAGRDQVHAAATPPR